jgi:cell division septum initiation protein DivIVA
VLLDIGHQLVVERDYHKLKDELEEKNDEIQVLKEEMKAAKGLISCQANRLVITSSPIIEKKPTREVDLVDASQDNELIETQVISYYKVPCVYHNIN